MRYAIQSCARARVSLVRGARGWRLVGAHAHSALLEGEALRAFARTLALVERLAGEERNEALFESLAASRALFMNASRWEIVELLSVARILHALGYLSEESLGHVLAAEEPALERIEADRDSFLRAINGALASTHL